MGREVRRVPLDFNQPLNKVWIGFKNPHYTAEDCDACNKTGYAPFARHLHDQWYGYVEFDPTSTGSTPFGPNHPLVIAFATRNVEACKRDGYRIGTVEQEARRLSRDCFDNKLCHHLSQEDVDALVAADDLMDFTHDYKRGEGWKKKDPVPVITAQMVNEWSLTGHGHNGGYTVIKARCEKAGEEFLCPLCKGNGHVWPSEEDEKRYEEWEPTPPPTGEAYQLWETVSEGSPVSPPFATPEELARWLVENDTSITKDTSYEGWVKFIKGPGWACSMVGTVEGGLQSGVKAFSEM